MPDPRTPPTADHEPAEPGVAVVLVEDHAVVREHLTRQLTAAGITVLAAVATVADGYQMVSTLNPDLVVLDNHLPDGLGIDLCRRLNDDYPHIPAVIHTADPTPDIHDQARAAGAVAVVFKTLTGNELITAIRQSAPRE